MPDFKKLDDLVQQGIAEGAFPGASYAVGTDAGFNYVSSAGRYMYCPDSPADRFDTIWDLASCSKVVGCTTAAMILFDEGKLKLDELVTEVLPEFGQNGKDKITVRNLLLHNSGLVADLHDVPQYTTAEGFMQGVYQSKPGYPLGTKTVYSDLSMITLGKMIEKITGKGLDEFVIERVFKPLGMSDSMYVVPADLRQRCAPTETVDPWREKLRAMRHLEFKPVPGCHPDAHLYIQGEVHDPSADVLNGISGNAGVFSTAPDLCVFLRMLLDGGRYKGTQIVKEETVRTWTTHQSDTGSRAFGWDTAHGPYSRFASRFSDQSFGHTGYTGTSVWTDRKYGVFGILLTNRVHPTSNNDKLIAFRSRFYGAVADICGLPGRASTTTAATAPVH